MPNHVTNKIYSNDAGLRKLRDYCVVTPEETEEPNFDFNTIIPQPDSKPEGWNNCTFGATGNWYEWNCNNWGTKWGGYSFYDEGDCLSFQTAWSTPIPIWEKLATMFPNDHFIVLFADEDIGCNYGVIIIENGVAHITSETFGHCTDIAQAFAYEVKGYSDYRIDEIDEYDDIEEFCNDYGIDYTEGLTKEDLIVQFTQYDDDIAEFITRVKSVVQEDKSVLLNLLTLDE